MKIAIVIPARYGSTRLPGKPLMKIGGQSMLSRVVAIARAAAGDRAQVLVATDDQRIGAHCDELSVAWAMTPLECPTGSDRVFEATKDLGLDFVINLQGDTPLTSPSFVSALIDAYEANPAIQVVTPVVQLTWEALDELREAKGTTPFSGTCALIDQQERAIWFSKQILPAIRRESRGDPKSPVFKHIGIYGYTPETLASFVSWPPSHYEELEGLEQLRLLENGCAIHTVAVDADQPTIGVDSPEDLIRVEKLLT